MDRKSYPLWIEFFRRDVGVIWSKLDYVFANCDVEGPEPFASALTIAPIPRCQADHCERFAGWQAVSVAGEFDDRHAEQWERVVRLVGLHQALHNGFGQEVRAALAIAPAQRNMARAAEFLR